MVEGEIIARSELPDPKKSDYPECRFTAHFKGNSIISGESCPKEISLVIEGFRDYAILPNNNIKNKDKVICKIIPFNRLPENEQSTQQANDLESYLLESYYVVDIKKIKRFSDDEQLPTSGIFFSSDDKDYISIFERRINHPIPDAIREAQAKAVKEDLDKMNRLLKGYDAEKIEKINADFAKIWQMEKEKDSPGYNRVGNVVWRNINNSFWALPETYEFITAPELLTKETLKCFGALKDACEKNGIQLIVCLIPNWFAISSRVINQSFKDIPDVQAATFTKQLLEIGIESLYVSDKIIENYNRYPLAFFFPTDTHPSDTTQDVVSDILVQRLKRYEISPFLDPELFFDKWESTQTWGYRRPYRYPDNCDIGSNPKGKELFARHIYYGKELIGKDKSSPVMFLGNSYMESPLSNPDALPGLVTFKTRYSVDWYRIGGHGVFQEIFIRILDNPEFFFQNKKVIILVAGVYHLYQVNQLNTMFDISSADSIRMLLNKKSKVVRHVPESTVIDNEFYWKSIKDKKVFIIGKDEEIIFDITKMFSKDQKIDFKSKETVLVVPALCFKRHFCTATINDTSLIIPTFEEKPRYQNLVFKLSPDGQNILKFRGKPGTIIAIKDFEIWQ